jgi:hypothetical protein
MTGTLHEDQYKFLTIYRLFLPGMKNVSDKIFREYQNPHVTFNDFLFLKSCRVWKCGKIV